MTTQHERDAETGLDYRGARFYDCEVGRFLSVDQAHSIYPSLNSYNYVAAWVTLATDPGGDTLKLYHYEGPKTYEHNSDWNADPKDILDNVIAEGLHLQAGQSNAFSFDSNGILQLDQSKLSNYTKEQLAVVADFKASMDGPMIGICSAEATSVLPGGGTLGDSGGGATQGNRVWVARSDFDIPLNIDSKRHIYGPDSSQPIYFPRCVVLIHEHGHRRYSSVGNRETHNQLVVSQEDRMRTNMGLLHRGTHDRQYWKEYWNNK